MLLRYSLTCAGISPITLHKKLKAFLFKILFIGLKLISYSQKIVIININWFLIYCEARKKIINFLLLVPIIVFVCLTFDCFLFVVNIMKIVRFDGIGIVRNFRPRSPIILSYRLARIFSN